MQDKLIKILNIKVDAIKKNIENLNYLNKELDFNNEELNYLSNKIMIFKDNDVLEFDKILIDDFKRILSMVDSKVEDIFKNKACNYQGIMYIIKGIREGISLELTEEQEQAISLFVEGMKEKEKNIKEIIANLESNKEKLPETNLEVLENTLADYEKILRKLDNNSYLTEIEEIIDALDFANLPMIEKINVFSYILKYNRDIYKESIKEEIDNSSNELNEVKVADLDDDYFNEKLELPKFSSSKLENKPIDNTVDLEEIIKRIDEKIKEIDAYEPSDEKKELPEIKLDGLDEKTDESLKENNDENVPITFGDAPIQTDINPTFVTPEVNQIPVTPLVNQPIEVPEVKEPNEIGEISDLPETNQIPDAFENQIPTPQEELQPVEPLTNFEEETLKEEPINSFSKEEPTSSLSDEQVQATVSEVFKEPTDELLTPETEPVVQTEDMQVKYENLLSNYQVLPEFTNYQDIMSTIKELDINTLEKALITIKNELCVKENEFLEVINVILKTMPSIFKGQKMLNTFLDNINFYKEHNINLINLFDNYRELLIIDTDILKRNYEIVKKYELELNNDNVKYLLCNVNLITNLDYYIEAIGHEKAFLGKEQVFDGLDYIKKYPYKLNMISRDTLLKLRYSTDNNLRIFGSKPGILAGEVANPKVDILVLPEEYKNLYFNYEYEFIDRSEMTNLLLDIKNSQDFNLEIDEYLEKLDNVYKINDLRYKINNLYFSRIKTIRVYNYLKTRNVLGVYALIIALTYQSVITKDEYKSIETLITKLVEGGN